MKNGIYPIVERDEKGFAKNNGKGLALFDVGDRYNPVTAIVKTLAITKPDCGKVLPYLDGYLLMGGSPNRDGKARRLGPYIRLEGNEKRPNILYVNSRLKFNRNLFETFYLEQFLKDDETLILDHPFILDSKKPRERDIETVKIEDLYRFNWTLREYGQNKGFGNWEIADLSPHPSVSDINYHPSFSKLSIQECKKSKSDSERFVELARRFVDSGGRK